jgi:hypothetical protein
VRLRAVLLIRPRSLRPLDARRSLCPCRSLTERVVSHGEVSQLLGLQHLLLFGLGRPLSCYGR